MQDFAMYDVEGQKPVFFGDQREVEKYIKEVYLHLSALLVMAFVGCYFQMQSGLFLFFPAFMLAMGCLMYVFCGTQQEMRLAAFMSFGFLDGWMLGPLLQALHPPPMTVLTAIAMTGGIFFSFTLAAMYSKRGTYLYLGGILGSAIWGLLVLGIVNIFFPMKFLFLISLYGGLVVFSLYVAYDTAVMIERAHEGVRDPLIDAINLFIDAMAIFRRVLIILSDNNN
eukprot:TRINITY_DN73451_c0_g1_i1.p1 TRINITY_DN73451_c0_g1~~TRINITY_DN73451_c0_g1_i1.p1  ORF type:complete len:225 (+),score=112.64 TRINITY_DN73451_c0_g1_i1:71-745(+)